MGAVRLGSRIALLLAAALAAGAPLARSGTANVGSVTAFPGWPGTIEGRTITPLPMSSREEAFSSGFPGRIGRFTDGEREIILRWVGGPTRKLHPASECLRAVGYAIEPLPARRTSDGHAMSCFAARKSTGDLTVCERVASTTGESFADISTWYWKALTGATNAPWLSTTIAERR
jgi:hypothetical protein